MSGFSYKDIYIEEGRKVLEVNILSEKVCNFDCIFCPIGRSHNRGDEPQSFDGYEEALIELEKTIERTNPQLVFINSNGEALLHSQIGNMIEFIKGKGIAIRLLTNGYLLGTEKYIKIANRCDEVLGEIKVITQEDFEKIQRPVSGYTVEKYIANMASFNKQYNGRFIFEITIIKGYNDDEKSIQKLKGIIAQIAPDKIIIERMEDKIFKKKLGITDERYKEISTVLLND